MSSIEKGYTSKYRPTMLSQLVGNARVKKTLVDIFENHKLPQSYLIVGTSGTGKTTLARIIAKYYLCKSNDAPCNECVMCQRVDAFISTGETKDFEVTGNLVEIDATATSKKTDIAELIETAERPFFEGGWRVYIIDECHMLREDAKQRLLKTIEEPPDKVVFILCTTELHKVPATVQGRCNIKLETEKPDILELSGYLQRILTTENISFDVSALSVIAKEAKFQPRQAVNLLGAIPRGTGGLSMEVVTDYFQRGIVDYAKFLKLLHGAPSTAPMLVKFFGNIQQYMGAKEFLISVIEWYKTSIYLLGGVPVKGVAPHEVKRYTEGIVAYTPDELAVLFTRLQSLLDAADETDLELGILRLCYVGVTMPTVLSSEVATGVKGIQVTPQQEKTAATLAEKEKKQGGVGSPSALATPGGFGEIAAKLNLTKC